MNVWEQSADAYKETRKSSSANRDRPEMLNPGRTISLRPVEAVRGEVPAHSPNTEPLNQLASFQREGETPLTIQQMIAQAEDLGEKRGKLLAQLLEQSTVTEGPLVTQRIELDQSFRQAIEQAGVSFSIHSETVSDIAQHAKTAQDRSFVDSLHTRFLELGVALGNAQGREVDYQLASQVTRELRALDLRLKDLFRRQGQEGKADALLQALSGEVQVGEHLGIDQRVRAESDARTICGILGGWIRYVPRCVRPLKQLDQIESLLLDKSSKELLLVNSCVRAMLGRSLFDALVDLHGNSCAERVRWITDCNPIGASVSTVARTLTAWFSTERSRSEVVRQAYTDLKSTQVEAFESLLAARLRIPVNELISQLSDALSERAYQQMSALRAGKKQLATVLYIEELIHSKPSRQAELRHLFKKFTTQDVQALSCLYQDVFRRPLYEEILKKVAKSPARDLCLGVLIGDQERVRAAKVGCAFKYRADFIGKPFINKSPEDRLKTIAAYNHFYHEGREGIWRDLRMACFREDFFLVGSWSILEPIARLLTWDAGNSYHFFESIVRNGEVSKAELLKYYMAGPGADVKGIISVLAKCAADEVPTIELDFRRIATPHRWLVWLSKLPILCDLIHNGDLRHDLAIELSGDHEFDVSVLLEGCPNSSEREIWCKALFKRLHQRFLHEQSGLVMRRVGGLLSKLRGYGRAALDFHDDYLRAVSYYRETIGPSIRITDIEAKRFATLVRHFEAQADAYRRAKVAISGVVLNSGAALGATLGAGVVFMVTAIPWWYAPIASGFGSLLWRWGQGRLVLGRGFGRRDANFQAVRALIDGSSMFTIKLGVATLGGLLGRQLSSMATKGSVKGSMHKLVQAIEERLSFQSKAKFILDLSDDEQTSRTCGSPLDRLKADIAFQLGLIDIDLAADAPRITGIVRDALGDPQYNS